ncbi:MAG: S8 family serine peptidase [Candidatus Sumerlaeia bacterium]|nr:S8 family serine peptidase [Candidatus Sumerlaeia bacterium]
MLRAAAAALLLIVANAPADAREPARMVPEPRDRVLVRLRPGADAATVAARRAPGRSAPRPLRSGDARWQSIPAPAADAAALAKSLAADPDVLWAHPDYFAEKSPHGPAADGLYPEQWNLRNTGQEGAVGNIDIGVEEAWAFTRGTPEIVVAVFDDGIEGAHPEFAAPGKLLPGFNVVEAEADGGPDYDSSRHGHAVAGIVGAETSADFGITGIAPNVRLLPVAGVYRASEGELAAGFLRLIDEGADVVNCSWGYSDPTLLSDALADAIAALAEEGRGGLGTTIVFSSGNDNLAAIPRLQEQESVLAVGAVTDQGRRAAYSNSGAALDLVAPSRGDAGFNWPPDGATTRGILTTDRVGVLGYTSGARGRQSLGFLLQGSIAGDYLLIALNGTGNTGVFEGWSLRFQDETGAWTEQASTTPHVFDGSIEARSYNSTLAFDGAGKPVAYELRIDIAQERSAPLLLYLAKDNGPRIELYNSDEGTGAVRRPIELIGANPAENAAAESGDLFGDYTATFGGTSAAAPQVAGAVALMLSVNPDLPRERVRDLLRQSSWRLDESGGFYDRNGVSPYYGWGLLDAGLAVRLSWEARYGPGATGGTGWLLR